MKNNTFKDMTSVMIFGSESQNRLADLNKLVSEEIKNTDQSRLQVMLKDLLSIAADTDLKKMAEKEKFLDGMESDFAKMRIELLKEANLMQAFRYTNDTYLEQLMQEITQAREALKDPIKDGKDAKTLAETLNKRIQELSTTESVGESFSAQIKLAEDNYFAMADRVWDVMMHIIPLLRGRMTVERSKAMTDTLRKLIMENETESKEKKGKFSFFH